MAKLQSLGFIFTLIISLGLVASQVQAKEKRPPNVVVFLVDDLGPHELVCYASRFHDTPNIDALAGKGMRFTHASLRIRTPSAPRYRIDSPLLPSDWKFLKYEPQTRHVVAAARANCFGEPPRQHNQQFLRAVGCIARCGVCAKLTRIGEMTDVGKRRAARVRRQR